MPTREVQLSIEDIYGPPDAQGQYRWIGGQESVTARVRERLVLAGFDLTRVDLIERQRVVDSIVYTQTYGEREAVTRSIVASSFQSLSQPAPPAPHVFELSSDAVPTRRRYAALVAPEEA